MVHTKTSSREIALIVQAWRKRTQGVRPYDGTRPKAGVSRDEIQEMFHHDLYGALVRQTALPPEIPRPETRPAPAEPIAGTPRIGPPGLVHAARRNRLAALMSRNLRRMLAAAEPVARNDPMLLTNIVHLRTANSNSAPDGNLPDPRRLHLTMAG